MGKQIGFYMTNADEQSFIAALQAEADVVVALNHFPTPEPQVLDGLPPAGSEVGQNTNLSIYNRAIDPKLVVYEVVARGEFALDLTRSEVIQFNRCLVASDGKLEPGRLWYDHETMRCKPKRRLFLAWAQSVFRFIKKNYHYYESNNRYFGSDAWGQFEEGHLTPFLY
jgi:hypothetical protein